MPSLFRRRTTELAEAQAVDRADEVTTQEPADTAPVEPDPEPAADSSDVDDEGDAEAEVRHPKGYTPSKRERGLTTPKRPHTNVRRPGAGGAQQSRKGMTKEEKRELKEARRARRREVSEGMRRGDPRYLAARDQGPEKAIARDVVDSRRTVGTWFFGAALVILLASSTAEPVIVTFANAMFITLTMAVTIDCVLLCRKTKWLVRERIPDSTQRMGGLYVYVVMRSITFRRLRIPLPRKKFGEAV